MCGVMLNAISKSEAKAKGLQLYFTGKVCRAGHLAERYVSTSNCVECAKAYSRAKNAHLRDNHPEIRRGYRLRNKYGLTLADYQQMLDAQSGSCAGCERGFTSEPFVDHDHATGKVRALLCRGCNTALGHVRDDPEVLQKLIHYLARHSNARSLP